MNTSLPSTSHKKLVAILFADISGYTALMQKDELHASFLLRKFQNEMNRHIEDNKGRIVNFYGDGALCIFETPLDAINAAKALQKDFGETPKVPTRIGIHIGTVTFEGDKVYGDSVNIASRIESMGTPQSILISKKVRDEVKNNPNLKLVSLGFITFKNVDEAIELFAIDDIGLVVPKKSEMHGKVSQPKNHSHFLSAGIVVLLILTLIGWVLYNNYLKKNFNDDAFKSIEEIAVLDFINETGIDSLDYLGSISASMIRSILGSSERIKLLSYTQIPESQVYLGQVKAKFGYGPQFEEITGIQNFLEGRYFLINDEIIVHAQIVNVNNNAVIHVFDPIEFNISDISSGIIKVQQKIGGYWRAKEDPLITGSTPRLDAYKEYYEALRVWGNDEVAIKHLINSINLDSTFLPAKLYLAQGYYNLGEFESGEQMLHQLEKQLPNMNEDYLNLYTYIRALFGGNNQLAHDYWMKEYKRFPKDLFLNTSALVHSILLKNDAKEALKISGEIHPSKMEINQCLYCQQRIVFLAFALIKKEREEEALQLLDKVSLDPINLGIRIMQIRALAKLHKHDEIISLIEQTKSEKLDQGNYKYLNIVAAMEYDLLGDQKYAILFADRTIKVYSDTIKWQFQDPYSLAYLIKGNYSLAQERIENILQLIPDSNFIMKNYYLPRLGCALAYQGKDSTARQVLDQLTSSTFMYDFGMNSYAKAQLCSCLGLKSEMLNHISLALKEGKQYYLSDFEYDPLLKNYRNDPDFLQLISPR